MEKLIEQIHDELEALKSDMDLNLSKERGFIGAGKRARKTSLMLEKLLKEYRKQSVQYK